MSAGGSLRPADDSWVAAVHKSQSDFKPLGGGVVIDDCRVLTAAHVAIRSDAKPWNPEDPGELWVAFPMASEDDRRRVERIVPPAAHTPAKDLAILILEAPVPAAVTRAPLRNPKPADLTGRNWWAFGFPEGDELGNDANGIVGTPLAYGWIRLDTDSRYQIERGFSGSGLWSPDYQAVVAVVGQDHARGDGRAITLHQAIRYFPDQDLSQLSERMVPAHAGELALTAWGWSLAADPEGVRHWHPRARGVTINSERGYRFRGRTAALRAITSWLDRTTLDSRVLLVTGAPGAGKSAVLGRVVITSSPAAAAELPAWDKAVRATPGSIACAVHAKDKTPLEIATEIARAASAALPEKLEDFAPALRDALISWDGDDPSVRDRRALKSGRRFNVLMDALDEATEARVVIAKVILPIAETCADLGAQLVVGSRRRDDDGDLLTAFGPAAKIIDLDDDRFFAEEDLAAYAQATLQIDRPGNPYIPDDSAAPVAARIAELSAGNFLAAGLISRTHGLYDEMAVTPADLSFTPTVDAAMHEYLHRIPPVLGVSAGTLLTALAFAEAPGLPADLWQVAVRALAAVDVPAAQLARFARTSAANFMIESFAEDGGSPVFRLFHQALNDSLLHTRAHAVALADHKRALLVDRRAVGVPRSRAAALAADERALTRSFLAFGRAAGWGQAPAYLLRSLPAHAARATMIDDLLADDTYLLHADLLRLLPLASGAESTAALQRARLLHLTSRMLIRADPPTRIALLSVTETLEDLGGAYTHSSLPAPYSAAWAATIHSTEREILEGHTAIVSDVCAFTLDGRAHLATAGLDGTIRVWEVATGMQRAVLEGHAGGVYSVCAFTRDGRAHLASGCHDGTVQVWDAVTGTERTALEGGTGIVGVMCAFTLDGHAHLAIGDDRTVRIRDAVTGAQRAVLEGHSSWVKSVCALTLDGRPHLASGGDDGTVRVWDAVTGAQRAVLKGHSRGVQSVCELTLDGRSHLASGGDDGTVRVWDAVTGAARSVMEGHTATVYAVCAFALDGRAHLAAGCGDGTVRVGDAVTGTERAALEGHTSIVGSVCAFTLDGHVHLATGSHDGTARVWDAVTAMQSAAREGSVGGVSAVCAFTLDGRAHLAAGSGRTIQVRDAATGMQQAALEGHVGGVGAVCAFTLDGRPHLASGCGDGTVRVWDAVTGEQRAALEGHTAWVGAVCAFTLDGRPHLASGGADKTVRVWDAATGMRRAVLEGHSRWALAMCAYTLDGRAHLAVGCGNGTVRVWDAATGEQRAALQRQAGGVGAVCAFTLDGHPHLATGSAWTVRIWDAVTGVERATLEGHTGPVNAACVFTFDGRAYLATGGGDRTVRIWDPVTAGTVLIMPTRDRVMTLAYTDGLIAVGTEGGLLAIRLNPGAGGFAHAR